jgi:hypothetical protein
VCAGGWGELDSAFDAVGDLVLPDLHVVVEVDDGHDSEIDVVAAGPCADGFAQDGGAGDVEASDGFGADCGPADRGRLGLAVRLFPSGDRQQGVGIVAPGDEPQRSRRGQVRH